MSGRSPSSSTESSDQTKYQKALPHSPGSGERNKKRGRSSGEGLFELEELKLRICVCVSAYIIRLAKFSCYVIEGVLLEHPLVPIFVMYETNYTR